MTRKIRRLPLLRNFFPINARLLKGPINFINYLRRGTITTAVNNNWPPPPPCVIKKGGLLSALWGVYIISLLGMDRNINGFFGVYLLEL